MGYFERLFMERNMDYLTNECVFVTYEGCKYCPWVLFDKDGCPKCEKQLYSECMELEV